MKSNYRRLGDFIRKVDVRNKGALNTNLLGLSMTKEFRQSTSNIVGTDLSKYKIVDHWQFACDFMSTIRVRKFPVVLQSKNEQIIVSPAYTVFEVLDVNELNPEYLMMWLRRSEFDRYAYFCCDSAVRGGFNWEELCDVKLPFPYIEKQLEIVKEYNTIVNRITINEQLIQKLEETAQILYKHWFEDFEFPNEKGEPYKSSGGQMVYNEEFDQEIPEGWKNSPLKKLCSKIGSGSTPRGGKEAYQEHGISLIRSLNVHDFEFLYKNLAHINERQAKKLDNVSVEEKDILLNITGASVARCTIVPCEVIPARVNQHVAIIRLTEEIGSPYYFLSMLCSSNYKRQLLGVSESGSTRQGITKSEIENLDVLLPAKTIRSLFNDKISLLFEHREIISSENELLGATAGLMLSKVSKTEII